MSVDANKKLYLVHTGFYDHETGFSVYEAHTNFFVAAASPQEAKAVVKSKPIYQQKRMHTDGIQEITAVQGYRIVLEKDDSIGPDDKVTSIDYNTLNPATPITD